MCSPSEGLNKLGQPVTVDLIYLAPNAIIELKAKNRKVYFEQDKSHFNYPDFIPCRV